MQFRCRVTSFGSGGFEISARLVDREAARDRWDRHKGFGLPRPAKRAAVPDEELTDDDRRKKQENRARARHRAKTKVRQLTKQIGATHLLTLTSRARQSTRDEMAAAWSKFVRLVRKATGKDLPYVACVEPHPSNPDHLHIHAAVASFLPVHILRRCWFIALGGKGDERGKDTPGNVDIQHIKGTAGPRKAERIARYISKYLTKELPEAFNRKRYWHSEVDPLEIRRFWIDAVNKGEAVDYVARMLTGADVLFPRDMFIADTGKLVWAQYVPPERPPSGPDPSIPF